jgi:hypothetical protein
VPHKLNKVVTKRPHFVPQTSLRAWADQDERVAYRRRDADTARLPNITNVAVNSGIYGDGQLGQAREDEFNEFETKWVDLRDELIAQGDLFGDRRSDLAVYMAHQLTRTIKHSEQPNFLSDVAASITEWPPTQDAIREYLARGPRRGLASLRTPQQLSARPQESEGDPITVRRELGRFGSRRRVTALLVFPYGYEASIADSAVRPGLRCVNRCAAMASPHHVPAVACAPHRADGPATVAVGLRSRSVGAG